MWTSEEHAKTYTKRPGSSYWLHRIASRKGKKQNELCAILIISGSKVKRSNNVLLLLLSAQHNVTNHM